MKHPTRDHAFAYVSTGDITSWARGTTKPRIPSRLGPRKGKALTVTDLDAMRAFQKKMAS